jgi:hypothetical protein
MSDPTGGSLTFVASRQDFFDTVFRLHHEPARRLTPQEPSASNRCLRMGRRLNDAALLPGRRLPHRGKSV